MAPLVAQKMETMSFDSFLFIYHPEELIQGASGNSTDGENSMIELRPFDKLGGPPTTAWLKAKHHFLVRQPL